MARVVVALGGNALLRRGEPVSAATQRANIRRAAVALAELMAEGHQLVITHGNGPQVGMIQQAFEVAARHEPKSPHLPMSVCVALSQGYIGYDLQNALREALLARGIHKPVATLVTQVEVDKNDPAFLDPSNPIGGFFSKEEAEVLMAKGERRPRLRCDSGF